MKADSEAWNVTFSTHGQQKKVSIWYMRGFADFDEFLGGCSNFFVPCQRLGVLYSRGIALHQIFFTKYDWMSLLPCRLKKRASALQDHRQMPTIQVADSNLRSHKTGDVFSPSVKRLQSPAIVTMRHPNVLSFCFDNAKLRHSSAYRSRNFIQKNSYFV